MKENNKDKRKNKSNLECSQELDCENCSKDQRVEFANEFDQNNQKGKKQKNRNNERNNYSGISSRTNAYAQGTEYSNELGTTRNAVDINNTHDNERYINANRDNLRNLSGNNNPYQYAHDFKYEIGDESYLSDISNYRVNTQDFDDLENARKSYFERLNNEKRGKQNNQNNNS